MTEAKRLSPFRRNTLMFYNKMAALTLRGTITILHSNITNYISNVPSYYVATNKIISTKNSVSSESQLSSIILKQGCVNYKYVRTRDSN